ncbi:MAG: xanthine dehydrogenase family protein molybdopterin-binding subunit [Roseicyclus sp.]|uniref:xanthine dehydrogenase family protein molybdopterin-binding subunit n=1 Tax=Roseicyclus sp. TaxID=1914329 RepID=UPI003BAF7791
MQERLGRSLPRAEDAALLRGEGRYTGDIVADGAVHLVVLRSPVASGWLRGLNTEAAHGMPGVLAILAPADMFARGIRPFVVRFPPPGVKPTPYFPLVRDRITHVGEALAVVVAATAAKARDAVEALAPDIEETPAVTTPDAALAPQAPLVWPDRDSNLVFEHRTGDAVAVAAALAASVHVIKARLAISRVTGLTLEPRGILVVPGPDGALTAHVGGQSAHRLRDEISAALDLPEGRLRVIVPETGGGFGMKMSCYPEYVLAVWAAEVLGRPVRWVADRTESFLSDTHAREQVVHAQLGLDADGHFTALDMRTDVAVGGQIGQMSIHPAVANLGGLAGFYRTPVIAAHVRGAFVNTQHMAPYRGAGRPEATYVIERMVDIAAARLGFDKADLRRRNLIAADAMPCATPLGFFYDSGDFPGILARALELGDHAGFAARQAEAAIRGRLRGLGIACAIEIAGGPIRGVLPEHAALELGSETGATLSSGSVDTGQGHRTALAQIVEAALGWPAADVRLVAGDSAVVAAGVGSFGSRSMGAAGTAIWRVCAEIVETARVDAADVLEVAHADIVFDDGAFRVAGTDLSITLETLVKVHAKSYRAATMAATDAPTFPNGVHLCEVEIDPETGTTEVLRYTVVDDVGTVINPLLLKGQIHGGVAQGLGQAMGEAIAFDPETGQQITASLMDYTAPRADTLSMIAVESRPTDTAANPLGAKGAGEAGTVGALAAGINAVVDALAPLGISHIDMPATPARIWQAIAAANARKGQGA